MMLQHVARWLILAGTFWLWAGCRTSETQPVVRSESITAETVMLRASAGPSGRPQFHLTEVNGRRVGKGVWLDGRHADALQAGWNRLSIVAIAGLNQSGRVHQWPVFLPGGVVLVIKGEVREKTAVVWLEDEATGERVTETVSLALTDG